MAAPANITIKSLQGKWVMNKSQSDSPDAVLALQGVGWITRKALGAATITQHLRQTDVNEDGLPATRIEIQQFITGGIQGTTETRTTDWKYRGHHDWLFGTVKGRSRYSTIRTVREESRGKELVQEDARFVTDAWLAETVDGEVVESHVENEGSKWTAWQLWGFAEMDGERKLSRRIAVRKTDKQEVVRIRLVYDYLGDLP